MTYMSVTSVNLEHNSIDTFLGFANVQYSTPTNESMLTT